MLDTLDIIMLNQENADEKNDDASDPFSVIPLKNHKCARETTEVFLGKRGINTQINFQYFKNLEVLWINDNNLVSVEGLDENFRVKELYQHNNHIRTLEGSLKHMRHLVVLTLYNNELSHLDHNIEYQEDYVYLEQLELFGNPLSEEPNYRAKVLHFQRNLNLFDRHTIQHNERLNADKLVKSQNVVGQKKPRRRAFKVYEQVSTLERETMRLAKKYVHEGEKDKILREKLEYEEYERVKLMEKPPLNDALLKLQNLEENQVDKSNRITEWEKSKFLASFKTYDPKKEGAIIVDDALKLFDDIKSDSYMIGKVPEIERYEFENFLKSYLNKNDKIGWNRFRLAQDEFNWTQFSASGAEARINALYKEAQSLFYTNKREESLQKVLNALSIDKNLKK